jgi:CRP-like cAMP-binding protein
VTDTQDLEGRLAALPLFSSLSRRHVKKLLGLSKTTQHHAGHEIAKEGEGSLALHLILEGEASVAVHGQHVRDLGPGDYFGEISMIDGRPRSASVTAKTSLSTLAVPHLACQQLIEAEPEVARHLLLMLCSRLREAEAS